MGGFRLLSLFMIVGLAAIGYAQAGPAGVFLGVLAYPVLKIAMGHTKRNWRRDKERRDREQWAIDVGLKPRDYSDVRTYFRRL